MHVITDFVHSINADWIMLFAECSLLAIGAWEGFVVLKRKLINKVRAANYAMEMEIEILRYHEDQLMKRLDDLLHMLHKRDKELDDAKIEIERLRVLMNAGGIK